MIDEHEYLSALEEAQYKSWPTNTPRSPVYPIGERPIHEHLSHWAKLDANKVAVYFYGHELSYGELDKLSDQFANWLTTINVKPGDPVVVFMPNCPQFIIAFMGILKAGAIYHPVSPLSKHAELEHQLNDCKPKAIVCFDQLLPIVSPLATELAIEHVLASSFCELKPQEITIPLPDLFELPKCDLGENAADFYPTLKRQSSAKVEHKVELDDIAAVNYTGGTTGLPKGCIHTHRHMIYTCASYMPAIADTNDRDLTSLVFLPQFWIAGEDASLLFPFYSGTSQVLLSRWDCEAFMTAVQKHQVKITTLLVDSVDEVLNHPKLGDYDLSSLQTTPCVSFIKKLTAEYRQRWQAVSGCQLFESSFGMTETNTCDTFTAGFQDNDFDLSFAPSFVGLPVAGTQFKVCDFESGELLPLGSDGELCLKSPALFSGYWGKPEMNDELFTNGWFKTGDLGVITEAGFIRYLGRRKEMIKVNGMSVFPTEIETLFGRHPAVLASAVIPREDEKTGQKPVAFVVLRPQSNDTEATLQAWCKDTMAIYKVPEIRLVNELPMTATGKVKKNELEKQL